MELHTVLSNNQVTLLIGWMESNPSSVNVFLLFTHYPIISKAPSRVTAFWSYSCVVVVDVDAAAAYPLLLLFWM